MQIKLFTIPISDNGALQETMNTFLRSKKVLDVQSELVSSSNGANWCFCIRYIEGPLPAAGKSKKKIDYKHVLDEATFETFSRLRDIRKKVAAEQGIPAFAVFTDEELAGLAKLDQITKNSMLSIPGIGDKKVERFAEYFITLKSDEKTRPPD